MAKAVLIKADDWEGLFVDGKLVDEGHALNQGYGRIKYFKELAKEYNFDINEMDEFYVTEEYEDYLCDAGEFHENLSDVKYE